MTLLAAEEFANSLCFLQSDGMLNGSPTQSDEANIGNVENNNPISLISGRDGLNNAKPLKKGGRKLRSTAPPHHHKPPRSGSAIRPFDHNNNNNNTSTASAANKPAARLGTEVPAGAQTVLSLHHLKPGVKKEVTSCFGTTCLPPTWRCFVTQTEANRASRVCDCALK